MIHVTRGPWFISPKVNQTDRFSAPYFTEISKSDYSLNMRTLFIIPLVLMSLVSFPSWGEDKINFNWKKNNFQEIICHCLKCSSGTFHLKLEKRVFLFLENNVIGFTAETGGSDKVRIVEQNYGQYGRSPTHFSWIFANTITYSLDRKTLLLENGYTTSSSKETYVCKKIVNVPKLGSCVGKDPCVYPHWRSELVDGYTNGFVDQLIRERQKELDKSMTGNQM